MGRLARETRESTTWSAEQRVCEVDARATSFVRCSPKARLERPIASSTDEGPTAASPSSSSRHRQHTHTGSSSCSSSRLFVSLVRAACAVYECSGNNYSRSPIPLITARRQQQPPACSPAHLQPACDTRSRTSCLRSQPGSLLPTS